MSTTMVLDPALSQALTVAIIPKLAEVGWSTGADDDSNLAEYIVLLVANGKTPEEIAAELSGDLLNLGPDDPQVNLFTKWLFDQVNNLKSQPEGGVANVGGESAMAEDSMTGEQDDVMNDASDVGGPTVPTGPKSMRDGSMARSNPRDKRMLGHLAKAMDRSSDAVLHRVRPQSGNERINTHRGPPTGPRDQFSIRGGARSLNNNGRHHGMGAYNQGQGQTGSVINMNMTHQQQFELMQLLEQQKAFFAAMDPAQQLALANGQVNPAFNPNFNQKFNRPQPQGKSLFDRVQAPPKQQQQGSRKTYQKDGPSPSTDVQMSNDTAELSPDTTCRFNLSCTNKDCKFAHQSPEAPPGTSIDVTDVCSFGAACKNRKCTGRHPSPAQRAAHQTEMECKFYPNCTNARCPFKHPTTPACRNGADCTTPNCKFTHVKTVCKFNPCLNPGCIFKHEEGQKRGKFEDKVWVAKEHVSERKFVDGEDKPEELILPGMGEQPNQASLEVIT